MPFRSLTFILWVLALLVAADGAWAQDPPAPAAQPGPQAAPPAAKAAEVKSVQYGDWFLRCVDAKAADGAPSCEVAQVSQIKQADQLVKVLTLSFSRPAPAGKENRVPAALTVTALLPMNVFLPAGFGLDADGAPVAQMIYRNCNEAGCWVQQTLDAGMVAALRKGKDGGGRIRLMSGQNINIKFSLKGLTEALNALQK
ncbi:MAG: invasion associated locus B family protein [Phyllobacterium sp.]